MNLLGEDVDPLGIQEDPVVASEVWYDWILIKEMEEEIFVGSLAAAACGDTQA